MSRVAASVAASVARGAALPWPPRVGSDRNGGARRDVERGELPECGGARSQRVHGLARAARVDDPLAHDADLDGYSELAGDCDDTDPYTSPDAEEVCDDYDNDCDGQINEDFIDEFEPLDLEVDTDGDGTPDYLDRDLAFDLGEVDGAAGFLGIGAGVDSASLGLTLHSEEDEDWVRFDADDGRFDSPNFRVTVGTFPTGGSYVVELHSDEGIEDIAVGSGRLSVDFEGDGGIFGTGWFSDSDYDNFWIRIYSDVWLASDCDRRITLEVEAL